MSRFKKSAVFVFLSLAATLLVPSVGHASGSDPQLKSRVVATITIPRGYYDLKAGPNALWLVNVDETDYATVRRIDPHTNTVKVIGRLDSSSGGFDAGFGSLWVSMYYANTVERIEPRSGKRVTAIPVCLQPQWTFVAFGSVWASCHHDASIARIDPASNRVIATIPAGTPGQFRSGPQVITADSRYIYVDCSNGVYPLTVIDPKTNRVVASPDTDVTGGELAAAGGGVWSADADPSSHNALQRLNPKTGEITYSRDFGSGVGNSLAVLGKWLWVAYDKKVDQQTGRASGGTLEAHNPKTGAKGQTIAIGGEADIVRAAYGDLWVVDNARGVVSRVSVG